MNDPIVQWRSYQECGELPLPSYVTARFEYFATGEGLTEGVAYFYASSKELLLELLKDAFGLYLLDACEITEGLVVSGRHQKIVPSCVADTISEIRAGKRSGRFSFYATMHNNYF